MKIRELSDQEAIAASQNIKERDYWLAKLSGEWVKSTFPYDRPKTGSPGTLQSTRFRLEGESYSALMKLSNKSHHRLFMILLAQLAVLLYKTCGDTDIILGMPIYRQEKEGKFINTLLALRNTFNADITFRELLLQVRQTVIDAVKHQNYPLETLMETLKPGISPGDFPLFDIAILLENIHDKNYINSTQIDILFSFRDTAREVEGLLEYNASLYNASSIERIITHYTYLVEHITNIPEVALRDIEILSEQEKKQVLYDFNDTSPDDFIPKPIHGLFEEQVEQTPDQTALVVQISNWNTALTYKELNRKSNHLAHFLRSKGVQPGTIVGILMEPSLHRISAVLGILKAGGAYLPIDPGFPPRRILAILDDSKTSLVLTDENLPEHLPYTALANIDGSKVEPIQTLPREQIKNFDALPLPDRTLVDYRKYHRYIGEAMAKNKITIQATRGCPYNCAFCHKIWPKTHVRRSAENIFEEILRCWKAGVKRIAFIDDIFNLDRKDSSRLFQEIIRRKLDVQLFFCNGLRADILTKDYIDLMIEAGTVNIDIALESGSPRIQKLIRKNLDLEKFYENVHYITRNYPQIILEMEMMLGFPTETEQEALMTLDFLKQLQWVHFPNLHILKIYPTSDMARLAVEHGVNEDLIKRSTHLAYHELPGTLPFSKAFAREFQARLMNEYFLLKERLIKVLPAQIKILAQDELIDKYDSYLPMEIKSFQDILDFGRITAADLGNPTFLPNDWKQAPEFNQQVKNYFPPRQKAPDAFKILLLDISQTFSTKKEKMIHNQNDEPLGLMYLLSYLDETFGHRITGKIFKAGIDFDSYPQLKEIILQMEPDLIGIRTLSYYKEFFHEVISYIRHLGVTVPIVSGGPYATSDHRSLLHDIHVDLVVLGEGELTFAELVGKIIENQKQLPDQEILKTIKGIAFLEKEKRNLLKKQANCREIISPDRLWDQVQRCPGENPVNLNQSRDLLYLVSTSGSTGKPKSVMLEHRNMANLLHFQFTGTNIDFSQRILQFASIGFDVSAQEIFTTLAAGGELYLVGTDMKADVLQLFDWIEKNDIRILFLPPAFLKLIFSRPEYTAGFPKTVKHIIAAGEQLVVPETLKNLVKQDRVLLHNHYGPSETHVVTTLTIDSTGEVPGLPSIGRPIANTRIYILDDNFHSLPIGLTGQLYIGGANVGRGYLNNPELTSEKFCLRRPGGRFLKKLPREASGRPRKNFLLEVPSSRIHRSYIYRTGDLARWLPDGTIEFKGRKDYQVKIRGYRIEPGEIESRLLNHDKIKEAVVVTNRDEAGEKYLCAYIVLDEAGEAVEGNPQQMDAAELRDYLSQNLPDYMVPAYFIPLEKIPLTPSGKVDKKALPAIEAADVEKEYTPPRNDREKKLCQLWSEVLGLDEGKIGIDDNFFKLGGHSLKATILITKIHKTFNVKITLGEIFNRPFIRGMAGCINQQAEDRHESIKPVEKKEYYSLSSAQKRLYIQQQVELDTVSYNMPMYFILEGDLDQVRLAEVFRQLIRRHENLRTSFVIVEGETVQRLHENIDFEIEYNENVDSFIRPFDLSRAPLLRVGLINLLHTPSALRGHPSREGKGDKYLLMLDMHHIITDGISLAILSREFMHFYSGGTLPDLAIQYKDFSQWQNRLLESEEIKKQEEYWLKQFEGDIPVPGMPTDYPRPDVLDFTGEYVSFQIDKELTARVNKLVLETGATLHVVLLAVCNILLSRYTGGQDIVVGNVVSGRQHTDLDNIIGVFVNMLVMRNRPTENKILRQFLEEVRENALDAYANQDYQFEELVQKLNLQGNRPGNPLFDVAFQTQNMDIPEIQIPGLTFKPYENKFRISHFDLVISCFEEAYGLDFRIAYSPTLFKRSTIEEMANHFVEILMQVLENREIKLAQIEISTKYSAARSTMRKEEVQFKF